MSGTTISFKAYPGFKRRLDAIARIKGINTSAYIKLIMTREMNVELQKLTENGFTLEQEIEMLRAEADGETSGPYASPEALMKVIQ